MTRPIHALLWETWHVSRVEAAWKFALGIAGALAVLSWSAAIEPPGDPANTRAFGAAVALMSITAPQFLGWLTLARLNGGRVGFPFRLLFIRPIRTAVMVGVPLAFLSLVPAAAYLVSALLLRAVTHYPFPLLPVAAWIAFLNLLLLATHWSSRKTSVATLISAVFGGAWMMMAGRRLVSDPPDGQEWHDSPGFWPKLFDFPLTDYALIAVAGLAAFAVVVTKVARQRSGDALSPAVIWTPGAGYPGWLVGLFHLPCPTSSATRAQLWFDLKSRGLPVLTIAGTVAIAIPLLFAVSVPIDAALSAGMTCSNRGCFFARPLVLMFAGLSLLAVLFQGGNAFGIRYRQGRVYASPFEMTQPYATAQLAILKLLLRAACFLVALVIVGTSIWISLPIVGDIVFVQMFNAPLSHLQGAINGGIAALPRGVLFAGAAVAVIAVVTWTSTFAALGALWTRYPRPGNIAAALVLLAALALAVLALAGRYGFVPPVVVDAIFAAARWIAAAAMVLVIAWVFRRGLAERVLSIPYVCGALLVSVVFGAAWLTLLTAIGAQPAASKFFPLPLVLMAGILAPWALNRIRHT